MNNFSLQEGWSVFEPRVSAYCLSSDNELTTKFLSPQETWVRVTTFKRGSYSLHEESVTAD